ncbi:MAG: M15 family metallopeptidase [Candidatus Binatia bacterium]
MAGSVTTTARLNIRAGAPSTAAPITARAEAGVVLTVSGLARGELVRGNADWFKSPNEEFFWAGGCSAFAPITNGISAPSLSVRRRSNGTIRALLEAEIRAIFGDIHPAEGQGGRVILDAAWKASNIVQLATPLLAHSGTDSLAVHAKARDPLARAFEAIDDAGLGHLIITCDGTFVARHKGWNAARSLSSHTWGIAIDLNARWNGYGTEPAPLGSVGSVRELVPHFEAQGFAWGGYFQPLNICDGMHFELARTDL